MSLREKDGQVRTWAVLVQNRVHWRTFVLAVLLTRELVISYFEIQNVQKF